MYFEYICSHPSHLSRDSDSPQSLIGLTSNALQFFVRKLENEQVLGPCGMKKGAQEKYDAFDERTRKRSGADMHKRSPLCCFIGLLRYEVINLMRLAQF